MNIEYELRWIHEGDALVSVMLQEGFKYIMCEIGEEDKSHLTMGQETPRFIVEKYEDGFSLMLEVICGNQFKQSIMMVVL